MGKLFVKIFKKQRKENQSYSSHFDKVWHKKNNTFSHVPYHCIFIFQKYKNAE